MPPVVLLRAPIIAKSGPAVAQAFRIQDRGDRCQLVCPEMIFVSASTKMFGVVSTFVVSKKKDSKSAEGNLVGALPPPGTKIKETK
jgi:hypothetical protein